MEYYNFLFKSDLKKAKDSQDLQKFLSETPYRTVAPIETKRAVDGDEVGEDPTLGERDILFRMTDSDIDRENDVILSAGADTDNFEKYGSILWGHRVDKPEFVLGRPIEVKRGETEIQTVARFLDADANPTADRVLRMIRAGAVRGMSIGLMILEYSEADRSGFMPLDIIRCEIIETSVTPVPVNPRAVALAVGGSQEEAKAVVELFEASVEDVEQLEASSEATGIAQEEIKSLVLRVVKHFNGNRVTDSGSKPSVLQYLAGRSA